MEEPFRFDDSRFFLIQKVNCESLYILLPIELISLYFSRWRS